MIEHYIDSVTRTRKDGVGSLLSTYCKQDSVWFGFTSNYIQSESGCFSFLSFLRVWEVVGTAGFGSLYEKCNCSTSTHKNTCKNIT